MGKSLSPYIPYNLQINMCDHQYHNNDIITTASIYNVEHKRFRQQILQCVQTYNSDHEKLDNSKELHKPTTQDVPVYPVFYTIKH